MLHSPVPVGANVVRKLSGIVQGDLPVDTNAGKHATIILYQGYASDGYKSGYNRRPCAWLEIKVDGQKTSRFRYGGKNYPEAEKQFNDMATVLSPDSK